MKSIVLRDDFREYEIRPEAEYNHYLQLVQKDTIDVFKDQAGVNLQACPVCGHNQHDYQFTKLNFVYRKCLACSTLFLSPRPTVEMLHEFYGKSEGLRFWNSKILQETDARKKHVFDPRIRWVLSTCDMHNVSCDRYLDYYTKYQYFIKAIGETSGFSTLHTYRPNNALKEYLNDNNYRTVKALEPQAYSAITAFEIFDRFFDPAQVLAGLYDTLTKDGLLFITTLSASGFDIRLLNEKSRSIVPPIHLNIFSVEGMIRLLESQKFEILELSSPGSLDVDLVTTAMQSHPDLKLPPVIDDLMKHRDETIKNDFQEFLQRALLSSHMRVVARKQ